MGNFVIGNAALPAPKVDANPPRGLPNELDAADINNLWNALADLRSGLTGPDAIYRLAATGAISRSLFAKLADLISINDFGIGDPTAVINVLENGRISQLPYIDPYFQARMDTGILGAQPSTSLVGEKQEVATFTRATTGTVVVGGVESTATSGQLRFQDNPQGLLVEPARTNFISAPDAPVNQTGLVLNVASYFLRVEGSGSITVALATGTATGLPVTVTAAAPAAFAITANGTVNTTVAGSVTFAQLENGNVPTSRIHAGSRNADLLSFAQVPRSGRDWLLSIRAMPNGGRSWIPNANGIGLFMIGDSTVNANVAFGYFGTEGLLRFKVNDAANATRGVVVPSVSSVPSIFLGSAEHTFWFYGGADGQMEIWIDGQKTSTTVEIATGTGIITTMPANIQPGYNGSVYLNGVVKECRLYYDLAPDRLPQPQWTRTTTPRTVACIGDSLTSGIGVPFPPATPYPGVLQTLLSSGSTGAWTVLNAGVQGDYTWQILLRWRAGVRRQTQKWVVLLGGTNDITVGVQTAVTAWINLTKIATQVRTDGKSLVMVTLIPRNVNTTAMDAERVKLNNSIRAYCAAGGAVLVDAFPDFDNGDGHTLKVAYDSGDGTHLNQAGYDHLAALVAAAIPH